MPLKREGILLHLSSLPGDFGIGDLGPEAIAFAGYLAERGYSIWQILPLNHRGYGNSPYNPISAFALDPLSLSPELLYQQGLIDASDLEAARMPVSDRVCYEAVSRTKGRMQELAASRYLQRHDIEAFIEEHAFWIKPYIAFLTLDRLYGDIHWSAWQPQHRGYNEALWQDLLRSFEPSMMAHAAVQAIIREQLQALRGHLRELNIELWGDLPIYLSYHSAEVWAHQDLFFLDSQGKRLQVAGVPPDAFSADGQLWGNPLYRWDEQKQPVFELISARVRDALTYVDRLRLDHFIGYVNYWSVPCPISTDNEPQMPDHARDGAWIKAPGSELFESLTAQFSSYPFIAEDLGILTEEVCQVRERFGFPGMIVLQFCWQDSEPAVEAYPSDRVIYTGTHDNLTTRQWFEEMDRDADEYLNFVNFVKSRWPDAAIPSPENAAATMIKIARISGCEISLFPMQDVLGLGSEARMNIPGTPLGNWEWRMK